MDVSVMLLLMVRNHNLCFGSEWDKETAVCTGILQRVKEIKWLGIYFSVGKHISKLLCMKIEENIIGV